MTEIRETPKRIQQRRSSGWRMPANARSVARPSKYGNPFIVGQSCDDSTYRNAMIDGRHLARQGIIEDREHAVALFTFWLMAKVPYSAADIRRELADKDLACWCPLPGPGEIDWCHARVLLDVANGEPDA